jgi:hypothetical protein
MPQLDKFAFLSQFIFLVIILCLVFFVVNFYIIPMVKKNLVFRVEKIASLIEKARVFETVFIDFIFFNLGLKRLFSSVVKLDKKTR